MEYYLHSLRGIDRPCSESLRLQNWILYGLFILKQFIYTTPYTTISRKALNVGFFTYNPVPSTDAVVWGHKHVSSRVRMRPVCNGAMGHLLLGKYFDFNIILPFCPVTCCIIRARALKGGIRIFKLIWVRNKRYHSVGLESSSAHHRQWDKKYCLLWSFEYPVKPEEWVSKWYNRTFFPIAGF